MSSRRWAGGLYVIGVLVMSLRAGEPEKLWWWLGALIFVVWISSPVLGGLWLWRLLSRQGAKVLYLLLLAIIAIAGFALQWHTMFIGPSDAQNALILVFVPLYQWVAVGLSFGLSKLLAWVSARE
jgi:hypothetical protein